jgi:branched-chain amino acid transport system permease protein
MKSLFTIREGGAANWVLRLVAAAAVGGIMLWIPTRGSNPLIDQSTNAFVLMAAAMALNLLLGFTGQISIGHSAFFGVGAYATGIFVSRYGWSPFATLPVAFVVAFVVGMLVSLPALRIKGIYLALVTLALGLVFPQVIKWRKLTWITGGPRGLDNAGFNFSKKRRTYEIFGWNPFGDMRGQGAKPFYFWIAVGVVLITYLVCRGVVKSRAGRALIAIRDNETAAAVMGVNLALTKAMAFGISAGLCALPGCVSTILTNNVVPDSAFLTIAGAITFLIVMVIGGAGSLWGPIIGSALFVYITQKTGDWSDDAKIPAIVRPLFSWAKTPPGTGIFAVTLIVLMFFAPHGIVGVWRRYSLRVLRVLPRSAGSGTLVAALVDGNLDDNVDDQDIDEGRSSNPTKGESS